MKLQKMSKILAFDTSNYTTSACVIDTQAGIVWENRIMIPVEKGKKGVRQSDAVFHHVKNLDSLFENIPVIDIDCVCASKCPSERENSYMPCFTVGVSFAKTIAALKGLPLYLYSHQKNHIMAAAVSGNVKRIINSDFIGYHISGGTTDIVLCRPDGKSFNITKLGGSADISCGQLIDRAGTLLGFPFPCGKHIEQHACGKLSGNIKLKQKDGLYNFSGFQNIIERMYSENKAVSEICDFALDVVLSFVLNSVSFFRNIYGNIPVLMSGGVMSDKLLVDKLLQKISGIYFADPKYSVDNSAGTAWLCAAERGELNV